MADNKEGSEQHAEELGLAKGARPLFIVGSPRAGTTFLHQIVNAHPRVLITDELRAIAWIFNESKKIHEGFEKHGNPYPFNHGEEFAQYLRSNAAMIIRPFYNRLARQAERSGVLYWGDKYPHYNEYLDFTSWVFPGAKYIFIQREMRDNICSAMAGHKWPVERAAQFVLGVYRSYVKHFDRLVKNGRLDEDKIMHVRYEKLATDVLPSSIKIFDFLDLEVKPELEKRIKELQNIQSHSIRKSGSAPWKYSFERQSLERWKRDLDAPSLAFVEKMLAEFSEFIKKGEGWLRSGRHTVS